MMKAILFIFASLLICEYVSAAVAYSYGQCPPPNKVYNDKPTCFSDADCQKWGKICCRNQFNTKSCVDRAPWFKANDSDRNGRAQSKRGCKYDAITKPSGAKEGRKLKKLYLDEIMNRIFVF